MTTYQVRINVTPVPAGFGFAGRGFIDSLDGLLKKTDGGHCVGIVKDGQITFQARTASAKDLTSLVDSYCGHFQKEKRQVEVVMVEDPTNPLNGSELAAGALLSAASAKLTKAFLMEQPEGVFLASNLMKAGLESVFAEPIGRVELRAAQWERIRAAGAHQRVCAVFSTEAHYKRWAEEQGAYFRSLSR